MAYKLYTTYNSKIKYIPKDSAVAIIMRFPTFIPKDTNIVHIPQLSPKTNTLQDYKKTNDWDKFAEEYKEQMYTDPETVAYLNLLMEALDNDNDVYLVCCEKDHTKCHRSLIGEYLQSLGYEWEEFNNA